MAIETLEIQARGLRFPALACGSGPLVLVQHGFPDVPQGFSGLLEALAAAGYRAVAPTLRGYAPGCLPPLAQVSALETAQDLEAIAQDLGGGRAALIGHDWGAVATYLCLGRSPSPFQCGVALAIPNLRGLTGALPRVPRQLLRSWYQLLFALPRLPDLWFEGGSRRVVQWAYRTWSPGYAPPPGHLAEVQAVLDQPELRAAALEYYRGLLRPGPRQRALLNALQDRAAVPTLCMYGERDGCMDARLYAHAAPRHPRAPFECEGLAGVGHFLHMEAPERVHARILRFLGAHFPPE